MQLLLFSERIYGDHVFGPFGFEQPRIAALDQLCQERSLEDFLFCKKLSRSKHHDFCQRFCSMLHRENNRIFFSWAQRLYMANAKTRSQHRLDLLRDLERRLSLLLDLVHGHAVG